MDGHPIADEARIPLTDNITTVPNCEPIFKNRKIFLSVQATLTLTIKFFTYRSNNMFPV